MSFALLFISFSFEQNDPCNLASLGASRRSQGKNHLRVLKLRGFKIERGRS
jgi:hypothetical protein